MKLTVDDLIDLVVDLTGRTYCGDDGVVDHAFESTGEWATEVLEALGIIVPVDGSRCRFRVLPRAEWPALEVCLRVAQMSAALPPEQAAVYRAGGET